MTAFVVAIAMCYVLIKIPFWILGSVKISQGRSVVGSMVKAFVAYKTAGLLGTGAKKAVGALASRRVPHAPGRGWTRPDPYENTMWTAEGQGMLPLPGVASSRSPRARSEAAGSSRSSADSQRRRAASTPYARAGQGRQGALLTRQGAVKPLPADRRRPPHPGVPREARPGEQTMLRVFARHEPDRPVRESVHDALSPPRPAPPPPPESEQPALFTKDGRLRAHARPPKPQPGDVPRRSRPGEQMVLNMPLRLSPEQARRRARHLATPPTPAEPEDSATSPPRPVRVRGQQALLRQDGSINPRARARVSTQARARARQQAREAQRRRVQSAPPPVQFQPPSAGSRRGRSAPAPEPPRHDAPTRRRRSTRLNPPATGTEHRGKDSSDD